MPPPPPTAVQTPTLLTHELCLTIWRLPSLLSLALRLRSQISDTKDTGRETTGGYVFSASLTAPNNSSTCPVAGAIAGVKILTQKKSPTGKGRDDDGDEQLGAGRAANLISASCRVGRYVELRGGVPESV